eukprot:jgi/Mesvir1/24468/Mv21832-RA.1
MAAANQIMASLETALEKSDVRLLRSTHAALKSQLANSLIDGERPRISLLIRCAEVAVALGELDTADDCLKRFWLLNRRTVVDNEAAELTVVESKDQFTVRACYAHGLLEVERVKAYKGRELVDGVLGAIKWIVDGLESAMSQGEGGDRYNFLLFNGSVHYWKAARLLQHDGLRANLAPSLEKITAALARVKGQDEWRVLNLISLALSHADVPDAADKALDAATKAADLAAKAAPELASEARSLRIHLALASPSAAAKLKQEILAPPKGSLALDAEETARSLLQLVLSSATPRPPPPRPSPRQVAEDTPEPTGKGQPGGKGAAAVAAKAKSKPAAGTAGAGGPPKPSMDPLEAERTLRDAWKRVDPAGLAAADEATAKSVTAGRIVPAMTVSTTGVNMDIVADIGWAAALAGARHLARCAALRAIEALPVRPRSRGELTLAVLGPTNEQFVAKGGVAVVPPPLGAGVKDDPKNPLPVAPAFAYTVFEPMDVTPSTTDPVLLSPVMEEARLASLRSLEDVLSNFARLSDLRGVEDTSVALWGIALPLLQPRLRRHVVRPFLAAVTALASLASSRHRLRARMHLELATAYIAEDTLNKAAVHVAKGLALDYRFLMDDADMAAAAAGALPPAPTSDPATSVIGGLLDRPLDRFLLPLSLQLRLRTDLYREPSRDEEQALLLLDKAREGRTAAVKGELLDQAAERLGGALGGGLGSLATWMRADQGEDGDVPVEDENIPTKPVGSMVGGGADASKKATADASKKSATDGSGSTGSRGEGEDGRGLEGGISKKDKAWLAARERAHLWGDLVRMAAAARLPASVLRYSPALLGPGCAGNFCGDKELFVLQAEVLFLDAEACLSQIKAKGETLRVPPPDALTVAASEPKADASDAEPDLSLRLCQHALRGVRLGRALEEPWLVINGTVLLWNAYLPVMQEGRFDDVMPVLEALWCELGAWVNEGGGGGGHTGIGVGVVVAVAEAFACAMEHRHMKRLWESEQTKKGQPLTEIGYKVLQQWALGAPPDEKAPGLTQAAEICDLALGLTTQQRHQRKLLGTQARVQRMRGKAAAAGASAGDKDKKGGAAAAGGEGRILALIEQLQVPNQPIAKREELVRAAMAAMADTKSGDAEMWTKLAGAAFAVSDYNGTVQCCQRALVTIPAGFEAKLESAEADAFAASGKKGNAPGGMSLGWDERSVASMGAGEITQEQWYWLAIAKSLFGRSILALLAPGTTSQSAEWELRRQALLQLTSSLRLAVLSGKADLVDHVARVLWNAGAPLAGAASTRAALRGPSRVLVGALAARPRDGWQDRDADVALRRKAYLLCLDCLADAGAWREGVGLVEEAFRSLPSHQHGPLWGPKVLFLSGAGRNVIEELVKLKDYDESEQARVWGLVARRSNKPHEQLAALQRAADVLSHRPWEQAEALIEYAQWLVAGGYPSEDAEDVLLAAADALTSLDVKSPLLAQGGDHGGGHPGDDGGTEYAQSVVSVPVTNRSRALGGDAGAESVTGGTRKAPSVAPSKAGGASRAGSIAPSRAGGGTASHKGAASNASMGGRRKHAPGDIPPPELTVKLMGQLVRIYLMLARVCDPGEAPDFLLMAQFYTARMAACSLASVTPEGAAAAATAAAAVGHAGVSVSGGNAATAPGAGAPVAGDPKKKDGPAAAKGGKGDAAAGGGANAAGAGAPAPPPVVPGLIVPSEPHKWAFLVPTQELATALIAVGEEPVGAEIAAAAVRHGPGGAGAHGHGHGTGGGGTGTPRGSLTPRLGGHKSGGGPTSAPRPDMVVGKRSIDRPELMLACLQSLVDELAAYGLHLHCLPVCHLMWMVAKLVLRSDNLARVALLRLARLSDDLHLTDPAAQFLSSAGGKVAVSEEERQACQLQVEQQQLVKQMLAAQGKRGGGVPGKGVGGEAALTMTRVTVPLLPHSNRHVWSQAATLVADLGDYVTAADLLSNALAHARAHEDGRCEAECLLAYARLELACARPREALGMLAAAQSVATDVDTVKRVLLAYAACAGQLPVDAAGGVLGSQHAKAGLRSGIELIGRLAQQQQEQRDQATQGHGALSPRQTTSADCLPKRAAAELMLALARILYSELGGGGYGGLLGPVLREKEEAQPDTGASRNTSGRDAGPLQNPQLFLARLAEASATAQEAVGLLRETGGGVLYLESCLLAADVLLLNPPTVEPVDSSPKKPRREPTGQEPQRDSSAAGAAPAGQPPEEEVDEERLADAQQLLQLAEGEALRLCGMALPNGSLMHPAVSLPVTRLLCTIKIKLAGIQLRLGKTVPPPSLALEVAKPSFPMMEGDTDASSGGAEAVARFLEMFADLAPAGRLLPEEIAVLQVSAARGWAAVPRQRLSVSCVTGAAMLRAWMAREELPPVWEPTGGKKHGKRPPSTWPPRGVPLVLQGLEELRSTTHEALSLGEYDVAEAAALELANFYGPRAPDQCAEALFLWQACVSRRRLLAMFVDGAGSGAEEVRLIRLLDALRDNWLGGPKAYDQPRKALERLRSSSEAWSLLEVAPGTLAAGGPAEGCLPPGGVAAMIQLSPDGDAMYCAMVRVAPPAAPVVAEPVKGGGKNAPPPPPVVAEAPLVTRRVVRRVPVDRSKLDRLVAICDAFYRATEKGLALGGGSGLDGRPPSKQSSTALGSRLASGAHTPLPPRDSSPLKLPNQGGAGELARSASRNGSTSALGFNSNANNSNGSPMASPRRVSTASNGRASRGGASYGAVDIDARGLSECWGDLSSALEELFAPMAATWREILAPFRASTTENSSRPSTARTGGESVHVHLFVDRQLARLPLEALGVFRQPGIASVSRDFSFQVFHNRVATAMASVAMDAAATGGAKKGAAGGGKGGKNAGASPAEPGLSCSLGEVSYLVDVRAEDTPAMVAKRTAAMSAGGAAADPAQSLSEIFNEEFLEEPIGQWTGLDGAKSIPGEGDCTRLLASAKTFVYFGLGRLLAYLPPRAVVPLHLKDLALALVVDRVGNEESLRTQAFADNRKSPRMRALEGPYETAALLSLRGVKTVVLNGMASTVDTNHTNVCKVITSIKNGNTVASAVRSCMQAPPPPEGERPAQWQPHDFSRYTLQVYGVGQMKAQA